MAEKDSLQNILEDTKALLSFHQSLEIDNYPLTDGLKKILETAEPRRNRFQQNLPKVNPRQPSQFPPQSPPLSPGPKETAKKLTQPTAETLKSIRDDIGDCRRCDLHKERKSILFGSGSKDSDLMIIGEWPTAADDQTGELFSAAEGEMLDRMLINVLKLSRNEVYLASIIKCMVPAPRQATREEIRCCQPFIQNQIAIIKPKIICTMGTVSAQTLLKTNKPLIRLRGRIHDYNGIPLIPTFHPSYLLKNPEMKKATLFDLQLILKKISES